MGKGKLNVFHDAMQLTSYLSEQNEAIQEKFQTNTGCWKQHDLEKITNLLAVRELGQKYMHLTATNSMNLHICDFELHRVAHNLCSANSMETNDRCTYIS